MMRPLLATAALAALLWLLPAGNAQAWHGYGYGYAHPPAYAYRPHLGVYFGAPAPPPPVYPYAIPPRVMISAPAPSIWLRL